MFRKVLIANRGEIALRVIRACKELNIETVAVYSEADRECLHTRFADDDVCIGGAPARDSYLNISRIIAAAEITGADAIHPGYGFLAENAEFADIVKASNITFIGPTGDQIRQMGDKANARKLAQKYKVPTVPGSPGPVADAETGVKLAEKIGFPVIIKAAAGGGGKGMRVALDGDAFAQAFALAQQEALAAFGSDQVYLEKYLARPRHIEIQIMGDTHGKIMHLCERDCSVQRRHQKLIEEAPSPAVDQTLREDLGESASRLAEAIGYVGAGTIEFLLDEDGQFYFMEMNTRIQVEHPVTEMTTNFDLVKEQIRVAAGEPLSLVMNGHRLRGHAIECRVNAEDPARNFQPSPGTITTYHPPGGPGVRVDSHIYAGYTVPPYYDSLLAKVIVHGNSRVEALARMRQALDSFIIEGVTTTIPFLSRVMRHEDFLAGTVDTKFLERVPELLRAPAPPAPAAPADRPMPPPPAAPVSAARASAP
jgi:acetyl-CoA carboxylase, biotin carboxylase subunit